MSAMASSSEPESPTESENPKPFRHPKLYHASGDLVIQSPPSWLHKNCPVLFRCHKFLLAHNSVVFEDMLSLPQPQRPEDMYDGADLLVLSDEAQDLEMLLKILYKPSTISQTRYDPEFPTTYNGVMALAMKYQFDDIRLRIIRHFKSDWPHTLLEWYAWTDQCRAVMDKAETTGYPSGYECWPEAASAVRFARTFGASAVLPAAFYRLSVSDPEVDWDDVMNGIIDETITGDDERLLQPVTKWKLLHQDEMQFVLILRQKWQNELVNMPHAMAGYQCECGKAACTETLTSFWSCLQNVSLDVYGTFDPLSTFRNIVEDGHKLNLHCDAVTAKLQQYANERRGQLWKELKEQIRERFM